MTFAMPDPRTRFVSTPALPCFGFNDVKDPCPACGEPNVYVTYHLRNDCPVTQGGSDDDDDDE